MDCQGMDYTGIIIGTLVSVAVGVLGFWGSIWLENRRFKNQRKTEISYQLYTDITFHINQARACIIEFVEVTRPLIDKTASQVEVPQNILFDLRKSLYSLLEGIQKHTDLNNIDKQVFSPLAVRLHPAIRTLNTFISDDNYLITNEIAGAILKEINPCLIEAKNCIDMQMPGWSPLI